MKNNKTNTSSTLFNRKALTKIEDSKINKETKASYLSQKETRIKSSLLKHPNISLSRNFNDYNQILTDLTDINKSKISWAIKLRQPNIPISSKNQSNNFLKINKKEIISKKDRNISSAKPATKGLILTSNFIEPKFYMEDLDKYKKKNKKTLEYLKKNKEISEKSGWERIKKMKYIDLLKAFFNSKKFANSVNELRQKEDKYYINNYLFFAHTYIDYFQSYKPSTKKRIKYGILRPEYTIPPIIPFPLFPLNEQVEDDNSSYYNLSFPSFDSFGINESTNQESLFSDEFNEDFR